MKCPSCLSPFNESQHTPYLITKCGHSCCQLCISKSQSTPLFDCPSCQIKVSFNSKDSFVLNEALLQMFRLMHIPQKTSKNKRKKRRGQSFQKRQSHGGCQSRTDFEINKYTSPSKSKKNHNPEFAEYSSKLSHSLASHTKQNLEELSHHISKTFKSKFIGPINLRNAQWTWRK